MDANNTTEQTAIQAAIKYKEFMQVAAWLGKLAAYQDKTYITAEWLRNNGFEPLKAGGYLLDAEVAEIEATLKDCEAGIWMVEVQYYESHTADTAYICTVGQMRLFLAAVGFEDILKA